jgi:hypothetical protein
MRTALSALCLLALTASPVHANPPVASYIFPAGGQRGTSVNVRVGGLFLHGDCGFEMRGGGVTVPGRLKPMPTLWFEGPLLPLPASQQAEDYPRDMSGSITIAPHAALGARHWRMWTSQGATPSMRFVVGELPELVEQEIDGDPVPVPIKLPLTINGRIFPREDIDLWAVHATKGQAIHCQIEARRLGSPLEAELDVLDAQGRTVTTACHGMFDRDPWIRFIAPADGDYQVRVRDAQNNGGQAYIYRLTLTSGPHTDSVFPLGGKRGSTIKLDLAGHDVPNHINVKLPAEPASVFPYRLTSAGQKSNAIILDVDDLPEYLESDAASSKPLTLPAVLNGQISRPGEVDSWTWLGKKGETYEFDLRAARLGSGLFGALSIVDASGKTLATDAASGMVQLDPLLRFTVPADGIYRVLVQDQFRTRGGPGHTYRLRVDRPTPDFRLLLSADAVTVPRKAQGKLKITAERLGGFKEPIELQVMGLPSGVNVAVATIAAGQNAIDLTFKADDKAKIELAHVWIKGTAKGPERVLARVASLAVPRGEMPQEDVLLMVGLPTPFVIKGEYDMGFAARGSVHKRKYKIIRNGYDGPIEVSLADRQARHLQGVIGPTIVVPAGADEFTYAASLPPWMETGRTCRVCVMGVGVLKEPDGSAHRVSFSSVNQNEQLVAVVGPGKLAMELPTTSFIARPGQVIRIPVHVRRGLGINGPVTIDLVTPAHVQGFTASPTIIAHDRDAGELTIRCAEKRSGELNMPLTVRATLMHNGEPLTAEVKIDVQP